MIVFIYVKNSKSEETVTFSVEGKRIPRKELDRMFKEAAKQLKVKEELLTYETF